MQNDTDKLKLEYGYGSTANNGNVLSQKITVNRPNSSPLIFDQNYTYDSLNRLKSAEEVSDSVTTWKQVYTFDRYGNRNFDEEETTTLVKNCGTDPNFTVCAADKKVLNPDLNPANNRMASGQDYTYDAAGNVIEDAEGRTFTYDAENKQVEVENSLSQTVGQYLFDGDGKRVKKIVPLTGEVTIFVYDAGAKLIGEYSTVVETQDPKVQYLTADHLGSPRINTDENGNITSRTDYMPYGEEITGLGGRSPSEHYATDNIRQGFTGYERDTETGLDFAQARYHSANLGRFSSPDPYNVILEKERGEDEDERAKILIGFISNPQRWNMYVYVVNNPLAFTDPDGQKPRTINVFLSTDVASPEQLKEWQDWAASAQKKDKDLTINIYQISAATPQTVNAFLESLKAKDTATIFMGHSATRRDDDKKIGILFDGWANLGGRGERQVTHSADGIDIQNTIVGIFSCDFGNGFNNITSSAGTAFASIIQGTQEGAHITTRTTAINAAAFKFTKSIANGSWDTLMLQSTLDVARARGQAGINANPHPDPNVNAGDYVGYRILQPPRKKR